MFSGSYNTVNLQTTLAASNPPTDPVPTPHHPISCGSLIWLDETGRMGCEHAQASPGDRRTQFCIDHSISILLLELMVEKEARDAG